MKFQSLRGLCSSCDGDGSEGSQSFIEVVSIPKRALFELRRTGGVAPATILKFQSLRGLCSSCDDDIGEGYSLKLKFQSLRGLCSSCDLESFDFSQEVEMFQSLRGLCSSCDDRVSGYKGKISVSIPKRALFELRLERHQNRLRLAGFNP